MNIPWGLHVETDCIIEVDAVPNGKLSGCVCPACGLLLIAKNRGEKNAHHFAHAARNGSGSGTCANWLHATAKRLLYDRIQTTLNDGDELPIRWDCAKCSCDHDGNLLKGIETIKLEKRLDNIRPDLYLATGDNPKTLIEIVDTHEPDAPVHDFAKDNGCPLLIFRVTGDERLRAVKADVLKPQILYFDRCACKSEARNKRRLDTPCDWRWCDKCNDVVQDTQGSHGGYGDHRHCASCGDLMAYTKGDYAKHYCCFSTDKFGLPRCEYRNPDHPLNATHAHCRLCGKHTRQAASPFSSDSDGAGFYRTCYDCYKRRDVNGELP